MALFFLIRKYLGSLETRHPLKPCLNVAMELNLVAVSNELKAAEGFFVSSG